MAGFKTHVSVSGAVGIGYGTLGYACGLPPTTAAVGACVCTLGGMLPDLDGDTGIAVREIVPLIATMVPIMLLDTFQEIGFNREATFLSIIALYFIIRFGVGTPFKRLTRHRGMWHSIPAAINVGLICFLITSFQDLGPRIFKASAITLGFLSHLVIDEIWSLKWFRAKRSAGTAFKLFTRNRMWPNILTYSILLILSFVVIFYDSTAREDYRAGNFKTQFTPDWSRFGLGNKKQTSADSDPETNIEVPVPKTGGDGLF